MINLYEYLTESLEGDAGKIKAKISSKKAFAIEGDEQTAVSLVKDACKDCKLELQIVYIDKAEGDDLQGIPVEKDGKQQIILPKWANEIAENKNKEYVVLFAGTPKDKKVLNSLMPIMLQHEIGENEIENIACVGIIQDKLELSAPMESRVRPIIKLK